MAGDAVISPNLTHVGWIPTDAGAVSMRVVQVGAQYDIRDRTKPVKLPRDQWWGELTGAGSGHALHQDSAGVWVADPI